jgi:signal transduction histidine kinase
MDNVRTLVSQFNEMQDQRLRTARGLVTDAVQRAWIAAIIGFGAAILGSIVAGWWVSHRVRERLMGLNRSMDRIGAGDLEHRAPEGGNDEVTGMARAVNAMAARIEESNKALDSFAYTVSHDLRAPLRALEGFSRAVQEDYADRLDDEGRDYLRRMVDAAQRMDQLINDLLAYSRLSRADVQMETVSLEEVVDLCVAELKADPQTRCADVVVDRPLPSALASRTILRQAIANLLTNAAKFVAAGITPRIAIKAHAADGRVRLEIADNGIGMAAEHLGRIFKVFERLHGGEAYPGTGIGLAIVEKGVQRMGGAVGVASRPGAGSRFWIELQQGKES